MLRNAIQGFTNIFWLGSSQRNFPQQEPALSNDRNVTGLSYKKNTTKVQQLETFSTQYTGVSKFLLGRIPAGGSSGIAKPSLGGDVQLKKLGGIAGLNPALCYSESQPVSFGASQQTVKNIPAEGEKSDILSRIGDLMQNPISYSFGEGETVKGDAQDADKNQQLETLKSANEELKTKLQESESKNKELESKAQELEILKDENNNLKIKLQESESKNKELGSKAQRLEILRSASESKIQDLQKQLESKNKELEDNKDRKPPAVNVQGVKSKVNYASASFILSGVCAVGASLATPYLAICIALAVAASVFLALGCYCLYKANTILSHVEVDQQDNQQLLESSL